MLPAGADEQWWPANSCRGISARAHHGGGGVEVSEGGGRGSRWAEEGGGLC